VISEAQLTGITRLGSSTRAFRREHAAPATVTDKRKKKPPSLFIAAAPNKLAPIKKTISSRRWPNHVWMLHFSPHLREVGILISFQLKALSLPSSCCHPERSE
jgi:hypothetical protein